MADGGDRVGEVAFGSHRQRRGVFHAALSDLEDNPLLAALVEMGLGVGKDVEAVATPAIEVILARVAGEPVVAVFTGNRIVAGGKACERVALGGADKLGVAFEQVARGQGRVVVVEQPVGEVLERIAEEREGQQRLRPLVTRIVSEQTAAVTRKRQGPAS